MPEPSIHLETTDSFIQHVEVWTPKEPSVWHRTVSDRFGSRGENVSTGATFHQRHRLVSRVLANGRAELVTREGAAGYDVALAIPIFRATRLDSVVVLACQNTGGKSGCVEMWEPSARGELTHAEGYYGTLQNLEFSSRLAHFRRGAGLPGLTWEHGLPHLIPDVRVSPAFVRAELAREHRLALGLGIPVLRAGDVTQVIAFVNASSTPAAAVVESWVPDASGRLWLAQSANAPGLEALGRSSRSTCFMRGEGFAGQAFETQRPIAWCGASRDAHPLDAEAARAGVGRGIVIPIVGATTTRAVLLLRI